MNKSTQKLMLVILVTYNIFAFGQQIGMKKSLTDDRSGQTYNNFRTDSTEVVFYQVLKPDEFIYDEPKNNAEAIYTLDAGTFVESVQETDGGDFIKIRVFDKFHGIVEGWVRSTTLRDGKYFGRSYTQRKKIPMVQDIDKKKNPRWIKTDVQVIWLDSTLAGTAAGTAKKGDIVFAEKVNNDSIVPVYFSNKEGGLIRGFIGKNSLSELVIIENASNDFEALFKKYDPVLLRNDVDKASFISFNGINFQNKDAKEFTEDKLCREISADTLSYRYTISSNLNDIKKRTDVKKKYDKANIAMYRFLPDQDLITTRDTVKCAVLEYASAPKSARILVNGMEESSVSNTIYKLFITHLEKFNMDIVFQKETTMYECTYVRNVSTNEIVRSDTNTEKIVKRMIAFRKH